MATTEEISFLTESDLIEFEEVLSTPDEEETICEYEKNEVHCQQYFTPDSLRSELQQTIFGKSVLANAAAVPLSNAGQKLVVDIVSQYHVSRKKKSNSDTISNYADVITTVFPREKKDTYYIRKEKGNPAGKIYSRINYIRQSERKKLKSENEHIREIQGEDIQDKLVPEEVVSAKEWLELNQHPWSSVLVQWEIAFPSRKHLLCKAKHYPSLLTLYPHISTEYGFQLLDIDFRLLELGNSADGLKRWSELISLTGKYISKNAKDPSAKSLLQTIRNEELSTDSRLAAFLLGLNTVLTPVKAANGFKPTIATAQADTLLFCNTADEAHEKIAKLNASLDGQRLPIVPKLVILDTDYTSVSGQCLVIYKSIEYRLTTIARGIDVLTKLNVVLGLPISKISKLVWLFVQHQVYKLKKTSTYSSINKLREYLDSNQPCSSIVALETA